MGKSGEGEGGPHSVKSSPIGDEARREGDGFEDCCDGMLLLVPLLELRSGRRRSRRVPASPPEGRDKVGDVVGRAAR